MLVNTQVLFVLLCRLKSDVLKRWLPIGQGNIVIDTDGTVKIYGFQTGNVSLDGGWYIEGRG